MFLSLTPTEETDEARVRTDCLNFDVSQCIQIKKKFNQRKEALGIYFCGILDPAAVQDCTKHPSLIRNALLQ